MKWFFSVMGVGVVGATVSCVFLHYNLVLLTYLTGIAVGAISVAITIEEKGRE